MTISLMAINSITRPNSLLHFNDSNDAVYDSTINPVTLNHVQELSSHMRNGITMYLDGRKNDFLSMLESSINCLHPESQDAKNFTLMHGMLKNVQAGKDIDPSAFFAYVNQVIPGEAAQQQAVSLFNQSTDLKQASLKFVTLLKSFNQRKSSLADVSRSAHQFEQVYAKYTLTANNIIPKSKSDDANIGSDFANQDMDGLYNQVYANSLGVDIAQIKHLNVIWASMLLFILCYENSNHLAQSTAQGTAEVTAVQNRLNLLLNSTAQLNTALTTFAGNNQSVTLSDMINSVFNKNNLDNTTDGVIRSQVRSYLSSLLKGQSANFLNTQINYNGGVTTIRDAVKNLLAQTTPGATGVNTQNIANGIKDVIAGITNNVNSGLEQAHNSAYSISYDKHDLTTSDLSSIMSQSSSAINSLAAIKSQENLEISRYLSNSQAFMSMSANADKIYSSTMGAVTSF